MHRLPVVLAAVALTFTATMAYSASPPPDRVLVEFGRGLDLQLIKAQGVEVAELRRGELTVLQVRAGTESDWPGVTIPAPGGAWDLTSLAVVEVRIRNPGSSTLKVFGRVDNPGSDGLKGHATGEATLAGGVTGVMRIVLKRTQESQLGGKLFGMRGYPVMVGGDGTIDAARVSQAQLFVAKSQAAQVFEIESIRATGRYVAPTARVTDAEPFLPFIDAHGQYRHRDWPGKVKDVGDLGARRAAEASELTVRPGPADWSRYGGWAAGPKLEASGQFRAAKHAGKWWLVDPEGYLFWSHGVNGVQLLDATPIDEREEWYEDFPGAQPDYAEFIVPSAFALKGHYAGRSPRSFSFAGANLRRKYGSDWRGEYAEVVHRRMRSWGLNTIGNWSNAGIALMRRTPYTDNIPSSGARLIEGSDGYWGKFPDVFDPRFVEGLQKEMEGKRGKSAGDPWCLGFFSDNEISWGDEVALGEAALRSPPDQPAKRTFLADLREKYRDIDRLNDAWKTSHASWDALLEARGAPERARAQTDLEAFTARAAETYFETVRRVIREVAPRQLYLGCRFARVNRVAAAAAARHCDVVSYNLFRRSVADFVFNGGADVPLLVGEFHFGALDRGMFHPGLVGVVDQASRAQAYRDYVNAAVRNPQWVGVHWFQWQDEPTTGRVLDEENYQIGFVDVADTPYTETIEAVRAMGDSMYRARLGDR